MRKFYHTAISVRDEATGEFKPLPALTGHTSYEIAKKHGFSGSEEAWYNMVVDNKEWPTELARVEALVNENKTRIDNNVSYVNNKLSDIDDLLTPLWSVEEPLRCLCANNTTWSVMSQKSNSDSPGKLDVEGCDILMIHSGQVYLKIDSSCEDNDMYYGYVEVLNNGNELYKEEYSDATSATKVHWILLDVKQGDKITVNSAVQANGDNYDDLYSALFQCDVSLYANAYTPYTYYNIKYEETETPSTDDIINVLLGEE